MAFLNTVSSIVKYISDDTNDVSDLGALRYSLAKDFVKGLAEAIVIVYSVFNQEHLIYFIRRTRDTAVDSGIFCGQNIIIFAEENMTVMILSAVGSGIFRGQNIYIYICRRERARSDP